MSRLRLAVACVPFLILTSSPHGPGQACDAAQSASDSLPATLYATFLPDNDRDTLPAGYTDSLGTLLQAALRVPDPLPIPAWSNTIGKTLPYISGDLTFVESRDGSIHDVRMRRSTLARAIDSAFVAAVQRVDADHSAPPLPDALLGDRVRLTMHVGLMVPLPAPVMLSVTPPPAVPGSAPPRRSTEPPRATLAHLRVPVWPEERPPRVVRASPAPPSTVDLSGTSTIEAVIDERGRVVRGSEIPLGPSTDRRFDAARSIARGFEFSAVPLGGCTVRWNIILPIQFPGR